jgi:hypothetical protein
MGTPPNPFTDQPPTTVTITDIVDHEIDPRKLATLEALGKKDAGDHNAHWAARAAHITDAPSLIVKIIVGILDEIMAGMGSLFEAAQGEHNSSFYDLAAKVVTDLTGASAAGDWLEWKRWAEASTIYSQPNSRQHPET